MEGAETVRAIPQKGLPEIHEGQLLSVTVGLVKGKWQYIFTYLAAEGPEIEDAVAGVRHG